MELANKKLPPVPEVYKFNDTKRAVLLLYLFGLCMVYEINTPHLLSHGLYGKDMINTALYYSQRSFTGFSKHKTHLNNLAGSWDFFLVANSNPQLANWTTDLLAHHILKFPNVHFPAPVSTMY